MCMHWLNYVRLNRKDRLKNMRGTTLEVVRLADDSRAHSAISSVYQLNVFNTGPLWIYLTHIGQQIVNGAALES